MRPGRGDADGSMPASGTPPRPRVREVGMNETLRLGNIAGVRVGVNWSVLVIVGLLMVGVRGRTVSLDVSRTHPLIYTCGGTRTPICRSRVWGR